MKDQSDTINELMAALAKAQGEMNGAIKDSTNPHFKTKYADLSSVWDACRYPLSKNGLAVTQSVIENGEMRYLVTTLGHASGQWIKSYLPINIEAKGVNAIQQLGSILTYLRRYGLSAIVGVSPEEDDGNGAPNYSMQKQEMKQKQVDVKPLDIEKISRDEALLLMNVLDECEPIFLDRVMCWLKESIKCENLAVLPREHYASLKAKAEANKEKYKKQQEQDATPKEELKLAEVK